MRIAVMGDDRRYEYLGKLLTEHGHDVISNFSSADIVVTPWRSPFEFPQSANVVTCGPAFSDGCALDLLKDEIYMKDIAVLTAEGAIHSAMDKLDAAINGLSCLVIGWGRIGKALCGLLKGLGANATCLSRNCDKFREILSAGASPAKLEDIDVHIRGKRVVFSTPPVNVLGYDEMVNADKGTRIIDLASAPYGVDIDAARSLGMNAWREPGLPGRYCPESAAACVYDALVRGGVLDG